MEDIETSSDIDTSSNIDPGPGTEGIVNEHPDMWAVPVGTVFPRPEWEEPYEDEGTYLTPNVML